MVAFTFLLPTPKRQTNPNNHARCGGNPAPFGKGACVGEIANMKKQNTTRWQERLRLSRSFLLN